MEDGCKVRMNICTALRSSVNFCCLSQSEVSTDKRKVSTFFAFQHVRCRCCYRSYLDRFLMKSEYFTLLPNDFRGSLQSFIAIALKTKKSWPKICRTKCSSINDEATLNDVLRHEWSSYTNWKQGKLSLRPWESLCARGTLHPTSVKWGVPGSHQEPGWGPSLEVWGEDGQLREHTSPQNTI